MEQNIPPIQKQSVGRTFIVAICVLGIIAVIQIVAAGIKLSSHLELSSLKQAITPSITLVSPLKTMSGTDISGTSRAAIEAEKQIRESQIREKNGDTEGALNLLDEADSLSPNNSQIIAKKATLFERLGQRQNARAQWQRLADMGTEAGEYYKQALLRLKMSPEQPITKSIQDIREESGLQPGSDLGIVECGFTNSSPTQKDLRIAIKSRPDATIDVKDVKIHVFFYEKIDGEITLNHTRVNSEWLNKSMDFWTEEHDHLEILVVHYPIPSAEGKSSGEPPREYYGYMVAVYYKDMLQDFRSDPVKLRELFPPKISLSE